MCSPYHWRRGTGTLRTDLRPTRVAPKTGLHQIQTREFRGESALAVASAAFRLVSTLTSGHRTIRAAGATQDAACHQCCSCGGVAEPTRWPSLPRVTLPPLLVGVGRCLQRR